jgi:hypothetical protein
MAAYSYSKPVIKPILDCFLSQLPHGYADVICILGFDGNHNYVPQLEFWDHSAEPILSYRQLFVATTCQDNLAQVDETLDRTSGFFSKLGTDDTTLVSINDQNMKQIKAAKAKLW